jgi:sugar phosphate permease
VKPASPARPAEPAASGALPKYRWAVLAIGAASTAAMAAAQGGLPALGPALQHAFGLSLVQVTGVFTAFGAGTVLTVYAWGALVDRVGERVVLAVGPALGGLALATVVLADSYGALLTGVFAAGLFAAAATGGSGRAVFGWFPRTERGLALGLRQTSVQLGTAAGSFTLPTLAVWFSLDVALLALAGGLVLSSVIAAIWLRDPPVRQSAAPPSPPAARDPRIWRLGLASALMIVGQIGLTSLLVLYLYTERDWSATAAAFALGFVQLGGAAARVVAGRWSDIRDERIAPFRRLAVGAGVLLLAAAALAEAPDAVLVPLLMGGGVLAMSWNGLSFTAAAEISGGAQAGRAMGMQNTLMRGAGAVVPVALGALAAHGSWRATFLVMGVAPLLGRALLGPLVDDEDDRRRAREARLSARSSPSPSAPPLR